ncbi:hypothetical protein KUTeg_022127 [Tegillarca granosa]|uniref:Uncharacterized protein n=1 Tax=Tegillarca granosa TaxID=220873 RepID=A0ABQ9E5B8_TEGGR|nr:hypothetical protein KUTeg_022127 [Tegillarca granosa]
MLNEFDVELGAMIDDEVEEINKIESQNDVSSSDSSLGDKGTDLDVEKIRGFFETDLKFKFELCEDFTKQEVIHKLEEYKKILSSKSTAKGYYCFFVVMMGHGKEEHILTADDDNNTYIEFDTVFSCFKNDKIKEFAEYYHRPYEVKFTLSLIFPIQVLNINGETKVFRLVKGKPRVFLIQSCRNAVTQNTVDLPDEPPEDEILPLEDNVEKMTKPIDSDILIAHATTPGSKAFRTHGDVGAWFIDAFIEVCRDSYEEDHLEEMLISVREKVAYGKHYRTNTGGCQMPCVWTTLTKRLFLDKPKIKTKLASHVNRSV